MENQITNLMKSHASIRKYKSNMPSNDIINEVVQAAMQAPFASQMYSILLTRKGKQAFGAPLCFTICIDIHKLELIMKKRNWDMVTNDLSLLLFGSQDASLMAQNMVLAGESYGLGSCLLGAAMYNAKNIKEKYNLPDRVFPLVQLVMGYPDEEFKPRPRYPKSFVLFEDTYPEFSEEDIRNAMSQMDEGYISQDYYKNMNAKIPTKGREDDFTFENYGWTEHISRKWGQWHEDITTVLEPLEACGFNIK